MSLIAYSIFSIEYLMEAGPFFIFIALTIGIIGFPLPSELLLIAVGYLAAHHKINIPLALTAAIAGSAVGMTVSYFLGRLVGHWFVKKYGKYLCITEENLARVKEWFRKIGKWTLVVGYFIPFFRHLVGFVAGSARLDFKFFALYAFSGAILWSTVFFAIGYYFNSFFHHIFHRAG